MNIARLFLLCPECYLEFEIKKNFSGELYFLTALGAVFDISRQDYKESIHTFLDKKNIKEIIIVNDPCCRLIQSVLLNNETHKTKAGELLQMIYSNCWMEFLTEKNINKRALRLSKLNIQIQVEWLREIDFIEEKIEKHEIKLRGMIYEREGKTFSESGLQ